MRETYNLILVNSSFHLIFTCTKKITELHHNLHFLKEIGRIKTLCKFLWFPLFLWFIFTSLQFTIVLESLQRNYLLNYLSIINWYFPFMNMINYGSYQWSMRNLVSFFCVIPKNNSISVSKPFHAHERLICEAYKRKTNSFQPSFSIPVAMLIRPYVALQKITAGVTDYWITMGQGILYMPLYLRTKRTVKWLHWFKCTQHCDIQQMNRT